LEAHLAQVGINPTVNKWDRFVTFGIVDPHDSLPHAAGVADAQAEDASLLPPDKFANFVVRVSLLYLILNNDCEI
jgi:TBCC domain-containing protein 1